MIYFSILNSLKMREESGFGFEGIEDYINTLYPDLSKGVNQDFANSDTVSCVIFRNYETITLQIIVDNSEDIDDWKVSINNSNSQTVSFGTIENPLNGATSTLVLNNGTHSFYNFTFSSSSLYGYSYLNVLNIEDDIDFVSEIFYVSEDLSNNLLSNNILVLKYKNEDGIEDDYYWTDGDYQEIKVDLAYYSREEFETESETADGESTTEMLESDTRLVKDFTLIGLPTYLYEKLVKASYCTDLYVNNRESVCMGVASPQNQKDGLSSVVFTYKSKNTNTLY